MHDSSKLCQQYLLLDRQHAQVVKPALGDTLRSVTATATATDSVYMHGAANRMHWLIKSIIQDMYVFGLRSRLLNLRLGSDLVGLVPHGCFI